MQSVGNLYNQQAAQYYSVTSPKSKINSVNSSVAMKSKSKAVTDKSMFEYNYDGSTGGMTGIR